jgi:phosphonopyruvate decarboxylase|tara:strand:- start:55 stop:501 length:447 start_codon:yes stop_codon:yes gene_type:complete
MNSKFNVILTCIGGYGALTLLEDFKKSLISDKVNFIGTHSDPIFLARSPLDKNYHYVLLNNAVHDSVGGQPIGAQSIDFLNVAKSSGFKNLVRIEKRHQLPLLKDVFEGQGPSFTEIFIKLGFPSDLIRPDKTPLQNKFLFEKFLEDC